MVTRGAHRSSVPPPRQRVTRTETAARVSLLAGLVLVVTALLPIGWLARYDVPLLIVGLALLVVWSLVVSRTHPSRPGESPAAHTVRRIAQGLSLGSSIVLSVAFLGLLVLERPAFFAVAIAALVVRVVGELTEQYLTREERRLQRQRDAEYRVYEIFRRDTARKARRQASAKR